jgi:hypothetical protein
MQRQTAVLTNIASGTSSGVLFFSNTRIVNRVVVNDSSATLYICLSFTAASLTNYTYKVAPGATQVIENYGGATSGIWDAANGFARCTEW